MIKNAFGTRNFKYANLKCDICTSKIGIDEEFVQEITYNEDVPIGIMMPATIKNICFPCWHELANNFAVGKLHGNR